MASMELRLYEECLLEDTLQAEFVCDYAEDGRIFIIGRAGIYIFTQKGDLTNRFHNFAYKKEFFEVSDFTPSLNLGLDLETFIYQLPKDVLYESILRMDLSAKTNIENTSHIKQQPVAAAWSPRGIVGKTDCLLAVLTNIFSLEIYVKYITQGGKSEYLCILNIAREITEHFRPKWQEQYVLTAQGKLDELKRRVEIVTPTALVWSHIFSVDDVSYTVMFVGHQDGSISAWKIQERLANEAVESKAIFVGRHLTEFKNITAMHWYKTSDYGGGITVGNLKGEVGIINVTNLHADTIDFDDDTKINETCDYVRVNHIKVIEYDDVVYIFVVKGSSVFIYAINNEGVVFDSKIFTSGTFQITGFLHAEKNITYILHFNGRFTELRVYCADGGIDIETHYIPLKIELNKLGTRGMVLSPNKVLLAVVASPVKYRHTVRSRKTAFVDFFRNMLLDPFQILMKNKNSSLRDYWDCFEMLRVTCLKEKRFPWIGVDENLNYDELSLQQLKILRLVSRISESVVSVVPSIRVYHIKPYVILHYLVDIKMATQRIRRLLKLKVSGQKLSKFQMQSIDLLNFFLKEMVMKNILSKAQLGENFINDIYEVMEVANELKYPQMPQCFWCGEKIIGTTCIPPHTDSRCAVSLMPILLIPGFTCPYCRCVVHKELEKEMPVMFCPYCDIPMEHCINGKNIINSTNDTPCSKNLNIALSVMPPESMTSACPSDCLNEQIDLIDIEDEVADCLTVSDDESDKINNKELLDLYFKASNSCEKKS